MSTNPHSSEPWWFPLPQQQPQHSFTTPMEPLRVEPIQIWPHNNTNNVITYHHLYQPQQVFTAVGENDEDMKELMFEKALTPSDVGKLNRLVIPKNKAEAHFPAGADGYSPSHGKGLILDLEDENGKWWNFRYSYWNSSQSYVLTKGWTRFVKEKQLEAGDVVMFHKHRLHPNRFFVSWRRRLPGAVPTGRPRKNLRDGEGGSGLGTETETGFGIGLGLGIGIGIGSDGDHDAASENDNNNNGDDNNNNSNVNSENGRGSVSGGCKLFGVNLV